VSVISVIVLFPIVVSGAFFPMLIETLAVPILLPESKKGLTGFIYNIVFKSGYSTILILIGTIGFICSAYNSKTELWPILVFSLILLRLFLLDFEGTGDLLSIMALSGLGVGLFVNTANTHIKKIVVCIVIICVVLSPVWTIGFGAFNISVYSEKKLDSDPPSKSMLRDIGEKKGFLNKGSTGNPYISEPVKHFNTLFWEKKIPNECHYRLSSVERHYLDLTKRTPSSTCGVLEF
jgi:hypothetical protein